MDTSKKYIEMCTKAEEIQSEVTEEKIEHNFYITVWLPRQDQLQEMVIGGDDTITLTEYFLNAVSLYCDRKLSMEQLWLKYVMKEKYGKVWDNRTGVIVNPDGDNKELEGEGWGWYYAGAESG